MGELYEFDNYQDHLNQNSDVYWENLFFASRREDGRPDDWEDRVHAGEDDYGDEDRDWVDDFATSDDQP